MKIIVDKNIPFIRGVLEPYAEVVYLPGSSIVRADVMEADALVVRTRTQCNAALLEGTNVRFIATATIGHDHIDADFCKANNITWTNAAGCNSYSVQQYIAAALVHLGAKLNLTFSSMTIGIVGVGNVGSKVARLARAFGMRVLLNDPPRERLEGSREFVSLEKIMEESDIITFHVPLNDGGEDNTFHLADAQFFANVRPSQILINSSRGEVVNTKLLTETLTRRGLAACVLDVWEHEPNIDIDVLTRVDIGTPHIAGYSADGKANGTAMSVNALSRFFGLGLPEWCPMDVPAPDRSTFTIDCNSLTKQEALSHAVRHTYDICADDRRLRQSPSTFEKQRAEYPLRREFTSYSAELLYSGKPYSAGLVDSTDPSVALSFQTIGFTLINTQTNTIENGEKTV